MASSVSRDVRQSSLVVAALGLLAIAVAHGEERSWRLGPIYPSYIGAMAGSASGTGFFSSNDRDYVFAGSRWWPGPSRPAGFSGRPDEGIAYDAGRNVIVACGDAGTGSMDETWEMRNGAWQRVSTPGPPTRWGYAVAYDAAQGVTILHGGSDGATILGDTWLYDGSNWALDSGPPLSPRFSHAMAFDEVSGQVVAFGGWNGSFNSDLGDTWVRDAQGWKQVQPTQAPSARGLHAMAYHPGMGGVVLYGVVVAES